MENSQIEWTTHTFNPWWGCMKVSEGCKNCYAAALDNRYNNADPHWGPNSPRKPMSDNYWKQPLKWDAAAKAAGIKAEVFCASMADWAEGQDTLKHYPSWLMVQDQRLRLMQVIATTPNLNWLLLTKRTGNVMPLLESLHDPLFMHDVLEDGNKAYLQQYKEAYQLLRNWLNGNPPENVWIGTSVENQETADERIPLLLQIPAKVRFLSCEPLLGPVDLSGIWVKCPNCDGSMSIPVEGGGVACPVCLNPYQGTVSGIHWVIGGGESGPGARPMHPDWARSLRDQCKTAKVAFFFKQWGEYIAGDTSPDIWLHPNGSFSRIGTNLFTNKKDFTGMMKVGKKLAGSMLDAKEHKEFPA